MIHAIVLGLISIVHGFESEELTMPVMVPKIRYVPIYVPVPEFQEVPNHMPVTPRTSYYSSPPRKYSNNFGSSPSASSYSSSSAYSIPQSSYSKHYSSPDSGFPYYRSFSNRLPGGYGNGHVYMNKGPGFEEYSTSYSSSQAFGDIPSSYSSHPSSSYSRPTNTYVQPSEASEAASVTPTTIIRKAYVSRPIYSHHSAEKTEKEKDRE